MSTTPAYEWMLDAKGELALVERDAGLFLATTKNIGQKYGNPWRDTRTGQFADGPPGINVLVGKHFLKDISNLAKHQIDAHIRGAGARQIAVVKSNAPGKLKVIGFDANGVKVGKSLVIDEVDPEKRGKDPEPAAPAAGEPAANAAATPAAGGADEGSEARRRAAVALAARTLPNFDIDTLRDFLADKTKRSLTPEEEVQFFDDVKQAFKDMILTNLGKHVKGEAQGMEGSNWASKALQRLAPSEIEEVRALFLKEHGEDADSLFNDHLNFPGGSGSAGPTSPQVDLPQRVSDQWLQENIDRLTNEQLGEVMSRFAKPEAKGKMKQVADKLSQRADAPKSGDEARADDIFIPKDGRGLNAPPEMQVADPNFPDPRDGPHKPHQMIMDLPAWHPDAQGPDDKAKPDEIPLLHTEGDGWPELDEFKVTGSAGGTTGAKFVEDAQGNRYVMKTGKGGVSYANTSPKHLASELLADALYTAMGVDMPEVRAYRDPETGDPIKVSRFVDGINLHEAEYAASGGGSVVEEVLDDFRAELRKDFAVDAWLGAWDVIGAGSEAPKANVIFDFDGKVFRIDTGGSLKYKGMGDKKPEQLFGYQVGELKTLRDPKINPSTADVFGDMADEEIAAQIHKSFTEENRKKALSLIKDPALRSKMDGRWKNMTTWAVEHGAELEMPEDPASLEDVDISYEPKVPPFSKLATGMIVRNKKGEILTVAPLGAYLGYKVVFPKGQHEPDLTPQQNAHKEVYEEAGTRAKVTGWLGDFVSSSGGTTRYYMAELDEMDPDFEPTPGKESENAKFQSVDAIEATKGIKKRELEILDAIRTFDVDGHPEPFVDANGYEVRKGDRVYPTGTGKIDYDDASRVLSVGERMFPGVDQSVDAVELEYPDGSIAWEPLSNVQIKNEQNRPDATPEQLLKHLNKELHKPDGDRFLTSLSLEDTERIIDALEKIEPKYSGQAKRQKQLLDRMQAHRSTFVADEPDIEIVKSTYSKKGDEHTLHAATDPVRQPYGIAVSGELAVEILQDHVNEYADVEDLTRNLMQPQELLDFKYALEGMDTSFDWMPYNERAKWTVAYDDLLEHIAAGLKKQGVTTVADFKRAQMKGEPDNVEPTSHKPFPDAPDAPPGHHDVPVKKKWMVDSYGAGIQLGDFVFNNDWPKGFEIAKIEKNVSFGLKVTNTQGHVVSIPQYADVWAYERDKSDWPLKLNDKGSVLSYWNHGLISTDEVFQWALGAPTHRVKELKFHMSEGVDDEGWSMLAPMYEQVADLKNGTAKVDSGGDVVPNDSFVSLKQQWSSGVLDQDALAATLSQLPVDKLEKWADATMFDADPSFGDAVHAQLGARKAALATSKLEALRVADEWYNEVAGDIYAGVLEEDLAKKKLDFAADDYASTVKALYGFDVASFTAGSQAPDDYEALEQHEIAAVFWHGSETQPGWSSTQQRKANIAYHAKTGEWLSDDPALQATPADAIDPVELEAPFEDDLVSYFDEGGAQKLLDDFHAKKEQPWNYIAALPGSSAETLIEKLEGLPYYEHSKQDAYKDLRMLLKSRTAFDASALVHGDYVKLAGELAPARVVKINDKSYRFRLAGGEFKTVPKSSWAISGWGLPNKPAFAEDESSFVQTVEGTSSARPQAREFEPEKWATQMFTKKKGAQIAAMQKLGKVELLQAWDAAVDFGYDDLASSLSKEHAHQYGAYIDAYQVSLHVPNVYGVTADDIEAGDEFYAWSPGTAGYDMYTAKTVAGAFVSGESESGIIATYNIADVNKVFKNDGSAVGLLPGDAVMHPTSPGQPGKLKNLGPVHAVIDWDDGTQTQLTSPAGIVPFEGITGDELFEFKQPWAGQPVTEQWKALLKKASSDQLAATWAEWSSFNATPKEALKKHRDHILAEITKRDSLDKLAQALVSAQALPLYTHAEAMKAKAQLDVVLGLAAKPTKPAKPPFKKAAGAPQMVDEIDDAALLSLLDANNEDLYKHDQPVPGGPQYNVDGKVSYPFKNSSWWNSHELWSHQREMAKSVGALSAVSAYTGSYHSYITNHLRGKNQGDAGTLSHIKKLDKLFALPQAKLKEPIKVVRGITDQGAPIVKQMKNAKVGDVYIDHSFASTSYDGTWGGYSYEILVPEGWGAWINNSSSGGANAHESEVLLDRGMRMKMVGHNPDNGRPIFEIIGQIKRDHTKFYDAEGPKLKMTWWTNPFALKQLIKRLRGARVDEMGSYIKGPHDLDGVLDKTLEPEVAQKVVAFAKIKLDATKASQVKMDWIDAINTAAKKAKIEGVPEPMVLKGVDTAWHGDLKAIATKSGYTGFKEAAAGVAATSIDPKEDKLAFLEQLLEMANDNVAAIVDTNSPKPKSPTKEKWEIATQVIKSKLDEVRTGKVSEPVVDVTPDVPEPEAPTYDPYASPVPTPEHATASTAEGTIYNTPKDVPAGVQVVVKQSTGAWGDAVYTAKGSGVFEIGGTHVDYTNQSWQSKAVNKIDVALTSKPKPSSAHDADLSDVDIHSIVEAAKSGSSGAGYWQVQSAWSYPTASKFKGAHWKIPQWNAMSNEAYAKGNTGVLLAMYSAAQIHAVKSAPWKKRVSALKAKLMALGVYVS